MTKSTEVIANLISITEDKDVKQLLGKYALGADNETNFKSINTFKMDVVKKAAYFLNCNGQVYLLKEPLIHWMLNKIRNLLPAQCSTCKCTYNTEYKATPKLACHLCGQGMHEPCYVHKMGDTGELPQFAGLLWFCAYCEPRLVSNVVAQPKQKQTYKASTVTETDSTVTVQSNTDQTNVDCLATKCNENLVVTLPPKEITNIHKEQIPVCIHFKRNRCRHGMSGNGCAFRHPKLCRKFITRGADHVHGCSKGYNCEFFHPKMCRTSVATSECYNENCRFTHRKGTRRTPPVPQQPVAPVTTPGSAVYEHNFPVLPNLNAVQNKNQTLNESDPNMNHFLVVLHQIQQQLNSLQATQQAQGSLIHGLTRNPTSLVQPPEQTYATMATTTNINPSHIPAQSYQVIQQG